jgi:hypothetical protein
MDNKKRSFIRKTPSNASVWRLGADNPVPPAKRCYWVLDGLLLAGAYPESPLPEHYGERARVLWAARMRTFINLTEEGETQLGIPLAPYAAALTAAAADSKQADGRIQRPHCLRFPIKDGSVPSKDAMSTILDAIDLSLDSSRAVYVHCLEGMGRTATVVGCWLIRHGLADKSDVLDAIDDLRQADADRRDRRAPETEVQRRFVVDWKE